MHWKRETHSFSQPLCGKQGYKPHNPHFPLPIFIIYLIIEMVLYIIDILPALMLCLFMDIYRI